MSSSVRGLLVAGGTAAVVIVVGVVLAGGSKSPPAAKTALPATTSADESTLSLEARRQARLAQSQAMLGGGKPVPEAIGEEAAAPMPPPPPPPAPPPPVAATNTDGGASAVAPPAVAPVVVALPPAPELRCTVATSGNTPVAEACRRGGRPEAKQLMKRLVAQARARGARYKCESCHADLDSFLLREDARSELASLLDYSN